ncbi:MAG TPA: hypothetical protein VH988_33055 [Thermoanaerobaculia bacterium]|jgi:hypothetical protein|nr:hypothetical protein [Thermoanaerobaculia bacterium]
MFCPDCGAEFEEGVSVCADCDVALVAESADEQDEHESGAVEFSPLVESTEVGFFSLITTRLEEANIPWFVQGEESLGVLPRDGRLPRNPGAQVAVVYVANNRVEAARQLMESLDPVAVGKVG